MDLAKFIQIRPVQMGNAFEFAKLHFRLDVSEAGAAFIEEVGKQSFKKTCELALHYLQSDEVIARANECLRSLSADNDVDDLQERINVALPPADVLRYAYRTCFAFPDIVDSKGVLLAEYSGDSMDHERALHSRFPDKLVLDLIALYLNPGVLSEYRTWLSFLLRICTIFESGYSMDDIAIGLHDAKGTAGLALAGPGTREFAARRFLHGRVLMPSAFRADLPPVMAPVMPQETDGLHSSKPTGQLRGQFDGKAIKSRNYVRNKVPHMSVPLLRPGGEYPALREPASSEAEIEKGGAAAGRNTRGIDRLKDNIKRGDGK